MGSKNNFYQEVETSYSGKEKIRNMQVKGRCDESKLGG